MSDLEARLHHSLKAPIPTLSSDFHHRLAQTLHPNPQKARRRQSLLTAYALLSAATTAALLLPQNLPWPALALLTLTPLATLPALRLTSKQETPPRPA